MTNKDLEDAIKATKGLIRDLLEKQEAVEVELEKANKRIHSVIECGIPNEILDEWDAIQFIYEYRSTKIICKLARHLEALQNKKRT